MSNFEFLIFILFSQNRGTKNEKLISKNRREETALKSNGWNIFFSSPMKRIEVSSLSSSTKSNWFILSIIVPQSQLWKVKWKWWKKKWEKSKFTKLFIVRFYFLHTSQNNSIYFCITHFKIKLQCSRPSQVCKVLDIFSLRIFSFHFISFEIFFSSN